MSRERFRSDRGLRLSIWDIHRQLTALPYLLHEIRPLYHASRERLPRRTIAAGLSTHSVYFCPYAVTAAPATFRWISTRARPPSWSACASSAMHRVSGEPATRCTQPTGGMLPGGHSYQAALSGCHARRADNRCRNRYRTPKYLCRLALGAHPQSGGKMPGRLLGLLLVSIPFKCDGGRNATNVGEGTRKPRLLRGVRRRWWRPAWTPGIR